MTLRDQGKWLHKKARKGVGAYPLGTVAFYGPDDKRATKVAGFLKAQDVRSVAMIDGIIGCPQEEGVDYPENQACPACPFRVGRDLVRRDESLRGR